MAKIKVTTNNGTLVKTFSSEDYFISYNQIIDERFIADLIEALKDVDEIESYPQSKKITKE